MLSINKDELTRLWVDGLLNDTSYFILCLKYLYQNEWKDRNAEMGIITIDDADLEVIRMKFQGAKGDKLKTLSKKAMLDALGKLANSSEQELEIQQLTLYGMEGFLGVRGALEKMLSVS